VDQSEAVLGIAKHDKDLIIILDLVKVISRDALNMKEECRGFKLRVESEQKP
jgi:hypothetical protein